MLLAIFILLVSFQFKHFICDYILQGRYMLGKFNVGWSFVFPLVAHSLVHTIGTFLIAIVFVEYKWAILLGLFDGFNHFAIDRLKASPNLLGRFNDKTKQSFWICLGLDQMLHHLVHYFIILLLLLIMV